MTSISVILFECGGWFIDDARVIRPPVICAHAGPAVRLLRGLAHREPPLQNFDKKTLWNGALYPSTGMMGQQRRKRRGTKLRWHLRSRFLTKHDSCRFHCIWWWNHQLRESCSEVPDETKPKGTLEPRGSFSSRTRNESANSYLLMQIPPYFSRAREFFRWFTPHRLEPNSCRCKDALEAQNSNKELWKYIFFNKLCHAHFLEKFKESHFRFDCFDFCDD